MLTGSTLRVLLLYLGLPAAAAMLVWLMLGPPPGPLKPPAPERTLNATGAGPAWYGERQ